MKKEENQRTSGQTNILRKIRSAKNIDAVEGYLASGNLASIIEVIRHEKLGPLVHERYSQDERSSVRFEVANQKNVANEILLALFRDKNHLVRTTAKQRLADSKH